MIISEQMKKLTATLRGIQNISSEERKAASRLSKLMTEERRERSPLRNVVGYAIPDKCLVVLTVHVQVLSPAMNGLEGEELWEERGIDIGGLLEGEEQVGVSVNEQEIDEEIKKEKALLTFELENLQNERYDHTIGVMLCVNSSYTINYTCRAVLTASLPKLEPYSPMDEDCSMEFPLNYTHTSSGLQYSTNDALGVGRDEFLKRQSMFASSKRQKTPSMDKRLSHDVAQLRDQGSSETMATTSSKDTPFFIISGKENDAIISVHAI